MAGVLDRLTDTQAMGFVDKVGAMFKDVPHLPKNFVESLVKFAPWFALLMAVLSLLAGPLLGVLSIFSLFALSPVLSMAILVASIISIINMILLFMAYGPLKRRELKGWIYLFWVNVLGVIEVVFQLVVGQGSLLSIIFAALVIYCLFEMKPHYSKAGTALEA